ncbi:hypothetical protein WIS52_22000 [Pseudonocardia nematodicida]|uniref:Integral membrane protein n=1 Tax=Pseudonocardia nematodicida TaxID=1206997 RepID=A0ABV1KFC0_9PSEU
MASETTAKGKTDDADDTGATGNAPENTPETVVADTAENTPAETPASTDAAAAPAETSASGSAVSGTGAEPAAAAATAGGYGAIGTGPAWDREDSGSGMLLGAGGLVSAGLGLVALGGSGLGDMMRARTELLGQIAAVTGGSGNQIDALYTDPWHTAALVNGGFGFVAAIIGAILVFGPARKPGAPVWGRALATGGLVLGVLGLLVSGGMYLDLFAAPPALPAMPGMPGMG